MLKTNKFIFNREKLVPFIDRLQKKKPAMIVALGDSNTGNFWYSAGGKQWPELIQTELRIFFDTQAVFLVNAGICGDIAADALQRLESDVLRFKPDLTFIAYATNDTSRCSVEDFSRNLLSIVETVQKSGSLAFLRTVPPIMEYKPDPAHIWKSNRKLDEIITATREIAVKCECPFVDIYGMWSDMEQEGSLRIKQYMVDEVHTNFEGHILIARQMLQAFGVCGVLHFEKNQPDDISS